MGERKARRTDSSVRASVLVLVVALLPACGGADVGAVDGPVLTSSPGLQGGMDAQVYGVLDLRDGCLLLASEDFPEAYPVIWPAGTTWQENPPAVVLEGGRAVELGTSVAGGGGYLQRDHLEQLVGSEVADAAAACAGSTGEIALLNNSEIQVR